MSEHPLLQLLLELLVSEQVRQRLYTQRTGLTAEQSEVISMDLSKVVIGVGHGVVVLTNRETGFVDYEVRLNNVVAMWNGGRPWECPNCKAYAESYYSHAMRWRAEAYSAIEVEWACDRAPAGHDSGTTT